MLDADDQKQKIILTLKKIVCSFKANESINIQVKFNDVSIKTDNIEPEGETYYFLEQNSILSSCAESQYIQIHILTMKEVCKGKITINFHKFINQRMLTIELNEDRCMHLYYECLNKRKNKKIDEETQQKETVIQNKISEFISLQFPKLFKVLYQFPQRLDLIVSAQKAIVAIFLWESIINTLVFAISFTAAIYNPRIALALGACFLFFGSNIFTRKLQQINFHNSSHQRILIPAQNISFLYSFMDKYCTAYDTVQKIIFSQDKTTVLQCIRVGRQTIAISFLLLIFIDISHVLVGTLWTILFLNSSFGWKTGIHLFNFVRWLFYYFTKLKHSLKKKIALQIRTGQTVKVVKKYYYYEYERWWLFRGWVLSQYSDEEDEAKVKKKRNPPIGWSWEEDWIVESSSLSDAYGYEYKNDFNVEFKEYFIFATVRRRKWKRNCKPAKSRPVAMSQTKIKYP